MTEPTALTFEQGYTRLQTIAQRVTSEDVPVAEMCELFAEGKGLQTALTAYLDEQKGRVEAIERGDGVRPFRIVAPAASPDDDTSGVALLVPSASDFEPVPPSPSAPAPMSEDDIPF